MTAKALCFLAVMLAIPVGGCHSKESKVLGTWVAVDHDDRKLKVFEDGTFSYWDDEEEKGGDYSFPNGQHIRLKFEGDDDYGRVFRIVNTPSDQLVLRSIDGREFKFGKMERLPDAKK